MNDWGFVSGRLRALQPKLLTHTALLRWAETDNVDSLLKLVKDTPYADTITEEALVHYDTALENYYLGELREIEGIVPDPVLVTLRKLPYDLNNLKIVLKSKLLGMETNWKALSENGTLPPEDVYSAVDDGLYSKFPAPVEAALKTVDFEYKRTNNLQIVDFYLDNAYNDVKFELLESKAEYASIVKYFRAAVDLENVKNVLRARKAELDRSVIDAVILRHGTIQPDYFIDLFPEVLPEIVINLRKSAYAAELEAGLNELFDKGTFGLLEKQIDEALARRLANFRYVSSGPEAVEEYLSLKSLEIKNLKILFIGKINNIAPDDMKERIRQNGI